MSSENINLEKHMDFPVASESDGFDTTDKSITILSEQILTKSNVSPDVAGMVLSQGCRVIYLKTHDYETLLGSLTLALKSDEYLEGMARIFYPPTAAEDSNINRTNAGRYIIAASILKFSDKKSTEIEKRLVDTKIQKSIPSSRKCTNEISFYRSLKNKALTLLRPVVTTPSSPELVEKIEAHFAKYATEIKVEGQR